MLTKKAYSLQELILYLEALEMLDMEYSVEKIPGMYNHETGEEKHQVWVIRYRQGELSEQEPCIIQFED